MTTAFLVASAIVWTMALMGSLTVEREDGGSIAFFTSLGMLLFDLMALWPYLRFEGL